MTQRVIDIGANETVRIINYLRTETDWSIGKSRSLCMGHFNKIVDLFFA